MMLPSIVMSLGVILIGQSATGPTCPVTIPEKHATHAEDPIYGNYGNGAIWTMLYPDGKFVGQPQPDGSLRMKFPWWRLGYTLTVEGRRLDAPAPPRFSGVRTLLSYGRLLGDYSQVVSFYSDFCHAGPYAAIKNLNGMAVGIPPFLLTSMNSLAAL